MSCPRKFYNKYIANKVHEEENVNLLFGKCVHTGIAGLYSGKSFEEVMPEVMEEWRAGGIVGDRIKNDLTLMDTLHKYAKAYRRDIDSGETLQVEIAFKIPVYNYNDKPVYLVGYLDRICKDHALYDTKTTGQSLTDYWFKKYLNSFQLLGYYFATVATFGNCPMIMVDGIKTPVKDDSCLSRRSLPVAPQQLAEWENTFKKVTQEILNQDNFWCNQTSCGDFSGCNYLPICMYGDNHPAAREMI